MSDHIKHEPMPTGAGEIVLRHVIEDLEAKAEVGKAKYGTYLRTNNGRKALVDAYQEVLDLAMYLKQRLLEDGRTDTMEFEFFSKEILEAFKAGHEAGGLYAIDLIGGEAEAYLAKRMDSWAKPK